MTSQDDISRAADRLKDALGAAADVMTIGDDSVLVPESRVRRAKGWLVPLTAAAGVVAIALGAAFAVHAAGNTATHGTGDGTTVSPSRGEPEFYMAMESTASGAWVLDVHRTADGAVTATTRLPGGDITQDAYLTAGASDRAFYVADFPGCTTAITVSRFYRIAITGAGRISGVSTVGSPVQGLVTDLAVSPDGSQMAYTLGQYERCQGQTYTSSSRDRVRRQPMVTRPQDVVYVMDLSTGTVRTWQNTATAATPARVRYVDGGLSWAPDGRTLVVNYEWADQSLPTESNLAVLGLDTASGGGSLQAHSRVLLHQDLNCVTCVWEALAGPGDSLTAAEAQPAGQRLTRQLIVRIPLTRGGAPTVLYRALSHTPIADDTAIMFADPSGRWMITWPLYDADEPGWAALRAGWISGGKLYRLPGPTMQLGNAVAW
jgi:hypothetical protein